jgi:hypothetical protein
MGLPLDFRMMWLYCSHGGNMQVCDAVVYGQWSVVLVFLSRVAGEDNGNYNVTATHCGVVDSASKTRAPGLATFRNGLH